MHPIKQSGFTLIEIVITIIVVAIIFLGIANFVEIGVRGYGDSIDRQRLQNQARFVVEKISREVRHAVPNSFNVGGNCLSFYPIKYAGFYHHNDSGLLEFIVNDYPMVVPSDTEYVVINPSQQDDLDTSSSQNFPMDETALVNNAYYTISSAVSSHSVAGRHYVYDIDGEIEYCIISGSRIIERNGIQIGEDVVESESSFRYADNTLQRGGIVHLDLTFERGGEATTYKHDIQVMNVQ